MNKEVENKLFTSFQFVIGIIHKPKPIMYKTLLFITITATIFSSCTPDPQEDATEVCDCWSEAFKVSRMDEKKQIEAFDACQDLYKEVLQKFEDNPENKDKFVEAYDFCRENSGGH